MDKIQINWTPTETLFLSGATTTRDGVAYSYLPFPVAEWTIEDGKVIAIPRFCRPVLKLNDDGTPTEMSRNVLWGLAIETPGELRSVPIGSMQPYAPFAGIATYDQGKSEYKDQLTRDLTGSSQLPWILVDQGETLIFQVQHASETLDVSECTIEIPIYEGRIRDGMVEVAKHMRRQFIGR